MCCEKCWSDAYYLSHSTGKSQGDCYLELLAQRKDNPCSPREQAGEYWDEQRHIDRRKLIEVTREMALDAGDQSLEGQLIEW